MSSFGDNRHVVLLKSLRTNNRFYALAPRDSGYRNADAIPAFPDDMTLGIAYPCLEDGLNDFAVIRTTFETIDVFPDDEGLRAEMMQIINEARQSLRLRLEELRDRVDSGQAHFLGTDLQEFKDSVLHLLDRGAIRRTLDNMMKLDVFESVSKYEAKERQSTPEPMYRFELTETYATAGLPDLPPRTFIARIFDDCLVAVEDDKNYATKYLFDRNVFQKFIAVMFVNYATTDPMFYGTNRADYGVSDERDMEETPLYKAVAAALRILERGETPPRPGDEPITALKTPDAADDLSSVFDTLPGFESLIEPTLKPRVVELPAFGVEQMLSEPFISIADALRLMQSVDHPRIVECTELIERASRQLFERLQQLEILSPMADNPLTPETPS